MVYKPFIKGTTRLTRSTQGTAMFRSTTANMINGKKLKVSFTTTGAEGTAVSLKCLHLKGLGTFVAVFLHPFFISQVAIMRLRPTLLLMSFFVLSRLLWMGTVIKPMVTLTFLSVPFPPFALVFPLPGFSLFCVFPSHKNTASSQRAALTRHAGKRQLGVIIP